MVVNQLQTQRPYSMLTKVTLGALVIATLAYASELLTLGFDREVTIIVGVLLIVDLLVAMNWRWTPILGVLVVSGLLVGNPFLMHNLSLPLTNRFFLAAFVQVISSVIVIGAGIGAAVQNYRGKL